VRIPAQRTAPSSAGLLLLDSRLNPIFVNRTAVQILSYPQDPATLKDLDAFLARKIRSTFVSQSSLHEPAFPCEIRSGKRLYLCRSFQGDSVIARHDRPWVAVLLERSPANSVSLRQISERFHLTIREQEVLQFLLQGLTTKEIAVKMDISPNTVKAFLRLIMVKMGVSTRSGIVGKALTAPS
jgi:DNA-binding CsgD family transcriptional regulator